MPEDLRFEYPYRVLLAEDNKVNQEVALVMLESFGLQVDIANNGQEAVMAAQQQNYALILMDMQMPEMDGLQATREIRCMQSAGQLPVLALTANAMDGDRESCLQAGMNGYLSKPFSAAQLYDSLAPWLKPPGNEKSSGIIKVDSQDASQSVNNGVQEATAPVDPTALQKIAALKPNQSDALLLKVIDLFLDTLAKSLPQLTRQPLQPESLRRTAHTLKSSSANVGAYHLSELCKQLEQAATAEVLSLIADLVAQIEIESYAVKQYFLNN